MVSWQNKAVAHNLRRPNCALCDCTRAMDPRIEHKPFVCLLHQRQRGAHCYHGIFAIHREASEHPRTVLPVQWRAATHDVKPLWCSVESVLLRDAILASHATVLLDNTAAQERAVQSHSGHRCSTANCWPLVNLAAGSQIHSATPESDKRHTECLPYVRVRLGKSLRL